MHKLKQLGLLLLAVTLAATSVVAQQPEADAQAQAPVGADAPSVPGEIIVGFKTGVSTSDADNAIRGRGVSVRGALDDGAAKTRWYASP